MPMNQDAFSQLLGKYSNEADQEIEKDRKMLARRETIRRIVVWVKRGVVFALLGVASCYVKTITARVETVVKKFEERRQVTPEQKAKINAIKDESERRIKILDETMK
jgi:hypothetical protein